MKKKLFYIIVIMFITIMAKAQASEYTVMFDSVFQHVSRTTATTGVLYERTLPFSGLARFGVNSNSADTINSEIFLQGYSEMYNAAFDFSKRLVMKVEDLNSQIIKDSSLIDIALFHYKYNTFDSIVKEKLYFDTDSIVREDTTILGSLYAENEVFIASPLVSKTKFQTIVFRLSNMFQFDNTTNPIISVKIDFDDGNGYQAVDLVSTTTIFYANDGDKIIKVKVTFANNQQITSISKLVIINILQKLASCNGVWSKTEVIYTDTINWSGYNTNVSYTGRLKIYYSDTISVHPKLMKPVFIVDGFDPENKRKIDICERTYAEGESDITIWDLLYYGNKQHIGKTLLNLGYDLVILDLPEGGGYIEANAMVAIKAINIINDSLQANNSKEQIVIVGPSMGGQITRYALTYMEAHPELASTNYGKHNCRLWVSFDSPHQGANISMGAQHLIKHFAEWNVSAAKEQWDKLLCSPAAKQMLIHHASKSAGTYGLTQSPTEEFTTYYNNIRNLNTATKGYPINLRKIAVSNGNFNNHTENGAGDFAFKTTIWWSEFLPLFGGTIGLATPLPPTVIDFRLRNVANEGVEYVKSVNIWLGVIPICFSKKFNNNYGKCSPDICSGGTYNTFDQVNKAFNYGKTTAVNQHSHCFMPVPSTLDIRIPRPEINLGFIIIPAGTLPLDYCTDISTFDLVAGGLTPFQSYCGSGSNENMQHVSFNNHIVSYLINEVETYITGVPDRINYCETKIITMHLPSDKQDAVVTWSCSSNLKIVDGQGTSTVTIRCINANTSAWITATASNLQYNKSLPVYNILTVNSFPALSIIPQSSNVSVIYNTPLLLTNVLTVKSGTTVTLANTELYCVEGSSIFVEPGGKLVINGSLLTSACSGKFWNGIVVEGNRNLSQLSTYQGFVELKNGSIIENARNAISTSYNDGTFFDNWHHNGGIIQATNTTFRNNKRSIEFLSYENKNTSNQIMNNVSYFQDCNFVIDNNFFEYSSSTQVTMWNVRGVVFKHCNFTNTSLVPAKGINSIGAGYILKDNCQIIIPCEICTNTTTPSSFTGFQTAVASSTEGNQTPILIGNTNFEENYFGIKISGINNYKLLKNNAINNTYAMMLSNTSGYRIEENTFVSNRASYDLTIDNSGIATNKVYKNYFNGNLFASVSANINAGTNTGLEFECNEYTGNLHDIYLYNYSIIKPLQGSILKGADNKFFNTGTCSLFSPSFNVRYFHSNMNNNQPYLPNSYFTIDNTAVSNTCESNICIGYGFDKYDASSVYYDLARDLEVLIKYFSDKDYQKVIDSLDQYPKSIQIAALNMQGDISKIQDQMYKIEQSVIHEILNDSILDCDLLKKWYGYINTPIAKYSLAETYAMLGEYNQANAVLDSIILKFDFTKTELDEHNNYMKFHNLKQTLEQSGRNWTTITELEKATLRNIREKTKERSSSMANAILCFFFEDCQEIELQEQKKSLIRDSAEKQNQNGNEISEIHIFPNPTKNSIEIINLNVEQKINKYELVTILGQVLKTQTENNIYLNYLPSGIYIVRIYFENGKIITKKIVKE